MDMDKAGIYHKNKSRDIKYAPSTDEEIEKKQFVLTTHMRFKHRYCNKQQVLTYNDKDRGSLIWDEKLIKSSVNGRGCGKH